MARKCVGRLFDEAARFGHNATSEGSAPLKSSLMNTHRFLIAVVIAAFFSACNGCFGCASPVNRPGSTLPTTCQTEAPLVESQKLEVLFVIDNSNSMREEQEGVARELTAFVEELRTSGGVNQDFRVGVVTTSVYQHTLVNGVEGNLFYPAQSGKLQPVPDMADDGGVKLGTGSERTLQGDDPDLVTKFARLVQVGVGGSGQETPFEAIRLALTAPLASTPLDQGGNQGFLRDNSRLLIVVITDEDDCSEIFRRPSVVTIGDNPLVDDCGDKATQLSTVSEYHRIFTEELRDGQGNRREIIYTSIAPVGRGTKAAMSVVEGGQVRNIDCPTSNEPGFRHRAMAEAFDTTLENLDSICKDSYHDTLVNIANLAGVSQVLEIKNITDPRLLQVLITRNDGTVQTCTMGNAGLESYDEPIGDQGGRIHFGASCKRRRDDRALQLKMLCAT